MFSFFNKAQKVLDELHTLITLAEQVVLALEQTAGDSSSLQASGPEKKRMALHMLVDLAHSHGLDPPVLLLDTAIEAAIRLTRQQR